MSPKIYSEKEKTDIRKRLMFEANLSLKKYGVKKTTVDELVRKTQIPKGTFYLFYPSKEMLLFDVINEYHEQMEGKLLIQTQKLIASGKMNAVSMSEVITDAIFEAMDSCLCRLFQKEEMDLLLKKLPDEVVKEHFTHDEGMAISMFPGVRKDVDMGAVTGAFRAVIFSCLYQREIGEENFRKSVELLVYGIMLQIMER